MLTRARLVVAAAMALAVGAAAAAGLHLLPAAGAATNAVCPYQGVDNLSSGDYYYVVYSTSSGTVVALDQELPAPNYGAHVVPQRGQAVLNITGNMSLVHAIWCDGAAGSLADWQVVLGTDQLLRTSG